MQQTTPSPSSSSRSMPPPPKPYILTPKATKAALSDTFVEMLQGPAVIVIVGAGPSATQYTLPAALLSLHSHYFRTEIARLTALSAAGTANKKRKLSSDTEPTVKEEGDASTAVNATSEKKDIVITLPVVDPLIFGLFLRFIYQGMYPSGVDAKASNMHTSPLPPATPSTPSTAPKTTGRYPPYTSPSRSTPNINPTPRALIPAGSHMPALLATTPTATAPSTTTTYTTTIPPSIDAWLLAQRLITASFMNYATSRIYTGVGREFALTPNLMHHVWINTTTATTLPSKLRNLLLDLLLHYWSNPSPNSAQVIAKGAALNAAWNTLFDTHLDLRRQFIFGMQGGGGKVAALPTYFVITAAGSGIAVGTGAKAGVGVGGMGGGKIGSGADGEEKSGGVGGEKADRDGGSRAVVVKKEGEGDRVAETKST